MKPRMKMLMAGACIAAALNLNALAKNKPEPEPVTFTKNDKTHLCTPIKPIDTENKRKKGEYIEKTFKLTQRMIFDDFDLEKNLYDVLYFHDFDNENYGVFIKKMLWLIQITETDYEKEGKAEKNGCCRIKKTVEYTQSTCWPDESDETIKEIYVISNKTILVTTIKNRIYKIEKTGEKLKCVLSPVVKNDDDQICTYRDSDGSIHFVRYEPDS